MHLMSVLFACVCALVCTSAIAATEVRVAFVVGNSTYRNTAPLANPQNDARDMAAALKSVGFDVVEALDVDKLKFDSALRSFTDKLVKADVALFFYAGHGLQVGLQNYLVPIDAKLERERDLEFEAVKLDFVMRQMEIDREGQTTIVILDACRDNPLARNLARSMGTRSMSIGRGLAASSTGLGTFIAYSTQPGNVAVDGTGRNSPFTSALVRHMGTTGHSLQATMIEVRKSVVAATDGKQVPWDHSALTSEFHFVRGVAASSPSSVAPAPSRTDADVAALQARLKKLEDEARTREVAQVPAAALPSPPPSSAPRLSERRRYESPENKMRIESDTRLSGLLISRQNASTPVSCRKACLSDPRCIGFQHGRSPPVSSECHLFSRVDARHPDSNWRAGVSVDFLVPAQANSQPSAR